MLTILAALALQTFTAPDPGLTRGEVLNWTPNEAAGRLLLPAVAASIVDGKVWQAGPPGFFGGRWWTAAAPSGDDLCSRVAYDAWISPVDVQDRSPASALSPRVELLTQYAPSYPGLATPERCGELTGWISLRPSEDTVERLRVLNRLVAVVAEAASEAPLSFGLTVECGPQSRGPCPEGRAALRDLPLNALYTIGRAQPPRGSSMPRPEAPIEARLGPSEGYNSWVVLIDDAGPTPRVTVQRVMAIYH